MLLEKRQTSPNTEATAIPLRTNRAAYALEGSLLAMEAKKRTKSRRSWLKSGLMLNTTK